MGIAQIHAMEMLPGFPGLQLVAYRYLHSIAQQSTSSTDLVVDSEAVVTLDLAEPLIALVIYNASNKKYWKYITPALEGKKGKKCAIAIDGKIEAIQAQEGQYVIDAGPNNANAVTCFCLKELPAGSHIFEGLFAANTVGDIDGGATVDERQFAVLLFKGELGVNGFGIRATAPVVLPSPSSMTDDPVCQVRLNLEATALAVIFYNVGNFLDEISFNKGGKRASISIDGEDVGWGEQCSNEDSACSATMIHAEILQAGTHTIKGRFGEPGAWRNTIYSERGLIVLLLNPSEPFWFLPQRAFGPIDPGAVQQEWEYQVETTGDVYVDDEFARLEFDLAEASPVLIAYNAFNHWMHRCSTMGFKLAINLDGVDVAEQQQSPYIDFKGNNATVFHMETLQAGHHVVKGRFASTKTGSSASFVERQLLVMPLKL